MESIYKMYVIELIGVELFPLAEPIGAELFLSYVQKSWAHPLTESNYIGFRNLLDSHCLELNHGWIQVYWDSQLVRLALSWTQ